MTSSSSTRIVICLTLLCLALPHNATLAEQPNGTLWEGDAREKLVELSQRVALVAESIKNTNVSKAFVTEDHQQLEQKGWGDATEAPDSSATYLP